jgi:hypothetical protein
MAQNPRIIDIRRSYLPMDPNAFPPTMHGTDNEDSPEARIPVIPYDGYNFMPTPQGYCSFFGTNSVLGIDALTGNVDDVFVVQTNTLLNIAIALKDDGIWTKDLSSTGAWVQVVVLAVPTAGTHKNWSRCVIDQEIFAYRQGEPSYWMAGPVNAYVFTAVVPTFLNMAGQLGIFKAGGRLGFWDSENSISWSAFGNPQDHEPSIETLAGNAIFQDIVGRIVVCLQHGNGFIIYCTRSIVHVVRNVESPMLFSGRAIFNSNGISYRTEALFSDPDTTHFVMTTSGFCEITNGQSSFVAAEASRYFKERRSPFYLFLINGKFLFLAFIDARYNVGRLIFSTTTEGADIFQWGAAADAIEGVSAGAPGDFSSEEVIAALRSAEYSRDQVYLNQQFGHTSYGAATTAQVPIWQNHLVSSIPFADLAAFSVYAANQEPELYFTDTGFTNGPLTAVDGSTIYFLPTKGPKTASGFSTALTVDANANDFYRKQEAIFYYEDLFYKGWLQAVEERIKTVSAVSGGVATSYSNTPTPSSGTATVEELEYDIAVPFVNPSFYSTRDKYYGLAAKSAWLQRSLVQGTQVRVRSTVTTQMGSILLGWKASNGHTTGNIAGALSSGPSLCAWFDAIAVAGGNGFLNPHFVVNVYDNAMGESVPARQVIINISNQAAGNENVIWQPMNPATGNQMSISPDLWSLAEGADVYQESTVSNQVFSDITEQLTFDTCVHKELGYTSIIGHGHYTSFGGFVQDNATPESTDYVDVCVSNPPGPGAPGSSRPRFNNPNVSFTPPPNQDSTPFYGSPGSPVIAGTTFTYPLGSTGSNIPAAPPIVIPGFSVLLQSGSIEPIYPTFEGAFIFDIHLKKWGKMKGQFKNLFDIFPVNNMAGEGIFPYEHFMPRMGVRTALGAFPLLDEFPTESELVVGKVGVYRKGFTDLEEVLIQHRAYKTGTLRIELSTDGRSISNELTQERTYSSMAALTEGFGISARWFNIVFRGFFDIIALEVRTRQTGRR